MKTINIFLASSSELAQERNILSYLAVLLDDVFARRGFRLHIQKWEHMDASLNKERKQTEYNYHLHESDLVFILFWTKLGKYTQEEYDEAVKISEKKPKGVPCISIFFKEDGSKPEEKLIIFRRNIIQTRPESIHSFSNNIELMIHFLLELNQHFSIKFHKPFLRLVGGSFVADDISICPSPKSLYVSNLKGENLSNIIPDYNGVRPINMLLSCPSDLFHLRNDFCDLMMAWNQIIAFRKLRLSIKFFDKEHLDDLEDLSELMIVIYGKDFGAFNQEDFAYTQNRIKSHKNPHECFTFFTKTNNKSLSVDFRKFKKVITEDNNFIHPHFDFSSADELRHKFLLQLELYLKNTYSIPEIEFVTHDGYICAKESTLPLVTLNELAAFQNNKEYQCIQKKLHKLDKNIEECKHKLKVLKSKIKNTNEENEQIHLLTDKQHKLDNQYQEIQKHSQTIEKSFLSSSYQIIKLSQYIKHKDEKKVISLLDKGKFEECQKLLDLMLKSNNIYIENYREEQKILQDSALSMLKGIIFDINCKLCTLKVDTNEKLNIIYAEFSKALKIFKSINHPYSDLIICFLNKYRFLIHKITDKSKIHEIVTFITQSFEISNKDFPYSILICLSKIYFDYGIQQLTINNYEDAENFLNGNLSIQNKLSKIQTDKYYFNISQTLKNLIKLYSFIGNIAKAKSLQKHLDKI